MQHREALTAYTGAFVDELAKVQIKHVVVSPGSRSTPLAYMLMEHPDIQVHMNIDERSAGFFALGLAKASNSPVGLLCTSGTAAANYYPAVVEAYNSRVPLLVMTADRPHELRDVGAPQAIDQIHLYGKHAKWFVEMALPENTEEGLNYARTICARAAAAAVSAPAGPVHLNFPFREPLIPFLNEPKWFGETMGPSIQVEQSIPILSENAFKHYADRISRAEKGLIVCGGMDSAEFNAAVVSLSEKIGFPILADPLSQLRSSSFVSETVIDTYDTFLRYEEVKENLKPDLILRFGSMPVSKALAIFIKQQKESDVLVIDGGAGWREPTGTASAYVYCNEAVFCREITDRSTPSPSFEWMDIWKKVRDYTKQGLLRIRDIKELDEGKLFALLNDLMPDGSGLFVGNSMPVRDLDSFFHSSSKKVRMFCNRGANGIDGVVSTALGVSTVVDNTVLLIGDLSFFHDMNGLLAAKLLKLNITIVVVNNDGGGIFSFLPQSNDERHYETLFGTPHGLNYQHAANLYGAEYFVPQNWDEFTDAFTSSFNNRGLKVIEVKTARESNVQKHRDLWKDVSREITSLLKEQS
ncbi:2-succinyl-5-enolpyruvyl-6-hydroxy-3-cyclohexene-1-carboxylic-acid synthase [Peribacillus deserti]|uniref:2-succinyl-5-enolpyruvyl-6-hydroxy-3-cyclohexene-1-carboxylate synthase n=1 Tax=Peribacillus deserti TaxID=673318 RepID=A0A2N5M4P0_9BACI|nr:2-succinyl-5-enolpyruvyl-6-hydroxy-3-cyclohexene-1-carboxylic-acid synthase [Peribacillus deserti]PLT29305.1 2-succinyl-5-enolpyruvyl-6-hydroxy-3-cyclohexene-1-carboxylic-acid synthase [Peribacillus deserti]